MKQMTLSTTLCALLAGGCSLVNDEFTFDGEEDGGTPTDGGTPIDAGPRDAGLDSGSQDAGACTDHSMCAAPTPFCGDTNMCVECVDGDDCADADPCTVDRCSLGECTHVADAECAGAIRAGGRHACALRGTRASCWGFNAFGQLGDTTTTNRTTPVRVGGLSNITEIVTGSNHTCALLGTGSVRCWGSNGNGQLGDDSRDQRAIPTPVVTLANAEGLSAGSSHTCALRTDGTIACWGRNSAGQVGNGMSGDDALRPAEVTGITDAVSVACGHSHTCALSEDGAVRCWGSNSAGQLGNGGTSSSEPSPVAVMGLVDAVQITAGTFHSCALRSTGDVVCWGGNDFGQLGDGSMAASPVPAAVPGPSDAVEVSAGSLHTCARHDTGTLRCWGQNAEGQLGDGTTTNSDVPLPLDLTNVVEVACGGNFTCARHASDAETVEVLCWGNNLTGQLGDGTMDDSPDPVMVVGL